MAAATFLGALMVMALTIAARAESQDDLPREIVFAVRQPGGGGHWYENFGYYTHAPEQKLYGAQGQLCRLDLVTGRLRVLVDDPAGAVRDPQVHYSGSKILFSYRPAGTDYFHLYEIGIDGSRLVRLTSGDYDDLEPTYLPDGRIMFCSSRARRWVPCWYSQVAVLYTCAGDGSDIVPVSANVEQDNTPWVLPDGRVIYERWEYVDRSRVSFHHLWTVNPDGTGQMVFYGNMHPGTLMIDAKPVPATDDVVSIFSPKHGKREHEGAVALVSPQAGPDDLGSARLVSQGDDYRDPYPLSQSAFLVARRAEILLMDASGGTRPLYRLPRELTTAGAECHEPRPLAPRQRERVIPPRVDRSAQTGTLVLADVYSGRNMAGVRRGEIKKLLVLEVLPKPTNDSGKMPPMSFGGTYLLERVLGTVPVEEDGSASFEVPAMRSLFFVALDDHDNSVKRMQSFLTVMPGETTSCVGCHEKRTLAPASRTQPVLMATARRPSRIDPIEGVPQVFDYPRDIQPLWDKHCIRCHDADERAGGVILSGDRGPIYSHSYFTLTALGQVVDGRDAVRTNLPPRAIGTSASPLMDKIGGSHYGARLSDREQDLVRYWIESAAPYPGTYAALGSGMIGGYPLSKLDTAEQRWPASLDAAEAVRRRCHGCHDKSLPMPTSLSDDMGLVLSNPDPADPRIRYSRHLMFNLSRPEKSLALMAPLAKHSGGYGLCRAGRDSVRPATIFANTADPDYRKILAMCVEGSRYLDRIKRFDMPGFRPTVEYTRQMKRFGILPAALPADATVDVYAADQAYWQSHWWRPQP